jgi:acetyl esterase
MAALIPLEPQFAVSTSDVEYQRPEGRPLLARLYRPLHTAAASCLLSVHGGAWVSGDRTSQQALDLALAASGVLVAAIDFRMPPDFPHPWQVRDVNLGIRWLKKHAVELGAASDARVGIFGGSSGGHVAILNALRARHADYNTLSLDGGDDVDARVDYVLADAPVTHPHRRFLRFTEQAQQYEIQRHLSYWTTHEHMLDASPTLILQRGERVETPPMLITQGTDDQRVPLEMTLEFIEAYRRAGGDAALHTFDGLGHGFILRDPARRESVLQAEMYLAFIRKHARRAVSA